MLGKDTLLRRLPAEVDPKQALFIDGIRHAVEIIDLAYGRLRDTLTYIATEDPSTLDLPTASAHAFLDAWAMVDAVDRFRMLCQQMPGAKQTPPTPDAVPLKTVTQPFRDLRNVADHLSARADFVISRGGAALGTLSWFTGFKVDPPTGWMCTLRPGTIRQAPTRKKEPVTMTVDWPTDQIYLSAGGYTANLSSVLPHIAIRVERLEASVRNSLEKLGKLNAPAASDLLTKDPYQLAPSQLQEKDIASLKVPCSFLF